MRLLPRWLLARRLRQTASMPPTWLPPLAVASVMEPMSRSPTSRTVQFGLPPAQREAQGPSFYTHALAEIPADLAHAALRAVPWPPTTPLPRYGGGDAHLWTDGSVFLPHHLLFAVAGFAVVSASACVCVLLVPCLVPSRTTTALMSMPSCAPLSLLVGGLQSMWILRLLFVLGMVFTSVGLCLSMLRPLTSGSPFQTWSICVPPELASP